MERCDILYVSRHYCWGLYTSVCSMSLKTEVLLSLCTPLQQTVFTVDLKHIFSCLPPYSSVASVNWIFPFLQSSTQTYWYVLARSNYWPHFPSCNVLSNLLPITDTTTTQTWKTLQFILSKLCIMIKLQWFDAFNQCWPSGGLIRYLLRLIVICNFKSPLAA